MKKLLLILVIPILSLLESCCNKNQDCIFYDDEIYFEGFNKNELDTIRVQIIDYKGAAYSIIDSFSTTLAKDYKNVYSYKQADNLLIRLREKINKKYTYKVRLNNLGLEYIINDFATKRKACDECFGQKSKWTDYIGGYNINGVYKEQEKITIYR